MEWSGGCKGSDRAGGHVVDEQATIGKQGGWESLALDSLADHVTGSRSALWLASRARSKADPLVYVNSSLVVVHELCHSVWCA